MYYTNNVVIIDHHGLFIYVDPGYPGLFYNINCLRASDIYGMWHDYFAHDDANRYTLNMCLEIQAMLAQRCL